MLKNNINLKIPKTIENPHTVDLRSVVIEHPRKLYYMADYKGCKAGWRSFPSNKCMQKFW